MTNLPKGFLENGTSEAYVFVLPVLMSQLAQEAERHEDNLELHGCREELELALFIHKNVNKTKKRDRSYINTLTQEAMDDAHHELNRKIFIRSNGSLEDTLDTLIEMGLQS